MNSTLLKLLKKNIDAGTKITYHTKHIIDIAIIDNYVDIYTVDGSNIVTSVGGLDGRDFDYNDEDLFYPIYKYQCDRCSHPIVSERAMSTAFCINCEGKGNKSVYTNDPDYKELYDKALDLLVTNVEETKYCSLYNFNCISNCKVCWDTGIKLRVETTKDKFYFYEFLNYWMKHNNISKEDLLEKVSEEDLNNILSGKKTKVDKLGGEIIFVDSVNIKNIMEIFGYNFKLHNWKDKE